MDKKEQTRLRVKRYRERQKSVTNNEDVTLSVTGDVTQEMVPASYVQGIEGRMYEVLPERARYLTLSDGQVLDRANQPQGVTNSGRILRMQAANEASYNFKPLGGNMDRLRKIIA